MSVLVRVLVVVLTLVGLAAAWWWLSVAERASGKLNGIELRRLGRTWIWLMRVLVAGLALYVVVEAVIAR